MMSQLENIMQQVFELSKVEQLRVYLELHRRLQDDIEQLGFLQLSEEVLMDWNNGEEDKK